MQNNRIKSNKKPGREKGHKRSAPQVCLNPDKTIYGEEKNIRFCLLKEPSFSSESSSFLLKTIIQ